MHFLLLLLAFARPDELASGRVLRVVGRDTVAAGGAMVLLHRVGSDAQGAVDSVRADPAGRFTFRYLADTAASYLVSARWLGLEYFAPPLRAGGNDLAVDVLVADTSSVAPVSIAARHVVVSGPAPDGARTVVDLIILDNPGTLTRVASEALPAWRIVLPSAALNVRVAESDFAAPAFDRHGDTLLLLAPVPPGQRQIFLDYQIAPGSLALQLPVGQPVLALNLMSEEDVAVTGMRSEADTTVNGRRFHRWSAGSAAPASITVTFPAAWSPGWLVPALVVVIAATLAALSARAIRQHPAPLPAGNRARIAALVDEIARLDDAHRGSEQSPAWHRYLEERARLKRELEALLP